MLGYEVIMANLDSGDWWNPDGSDIAETLLAGAAPGDIILLHDAIAGFRGRSPHPPIGAPCWRGSSRSSRRRPDDSVS
jgi:hypothetical protein